MTKQEADFIGSMNMCDEISNEAYKKIMCHCEVEESQPITSPSQHWAKQAENFGEIAMNEIKKARSCEDCISREEVNNIIERRTYGHYMEFGDYIGEDTRYVKIINTDAIKNDIYQLPSVQPQRKKGKWNIRNLVNQFIKEQDIRILECSECGIARRELLGDEFYLNYCPNCGAYMRGDDE